MSCYVAEKINLYKVNTVQPYINEVDIFFCLHDV